MSEHDDLSMPPPEEEAPRRAASARLEVRGGQGREAMLREALLYQGLDMPTNAVPYHAKSLPISKVRQGCLSPEAKHDG